MNLDQLSYIQRETLKGLYAMGGIAKRSDIARAANIDGLKVSAALTRLESFGFADKGEDQRWRLSDSGKLILQNEPAPNPEPAPKPEPQPKSMREKMAGELRAMTRPPFDPSDAAWLCRALAEEHHGMPTISDLLRQISAYFEKN